jgi:hypothetical protein
MINATSRLMHINAGTAISKKVCYQVYKGTINFLSQVDTWVWDTLRRRGRAPC